MSLEDLIKSLEQKLPGFSYTVFSHQPGMPVFLQWNHRSSDLQKREATMPRSIVAKDVKSGFEEVLRRYEAFEQEDTLKKAALAKQEAAGKRKVEWVERNNAQALERIQRRAEEGPEAPEPPIKTPRKVLAEPPPRRRSVVLPE